MKIAHCTVLAATALAWACATASPPAKPICPNGQIGGIIQSNTKVGETLVTLFKGDKVPFRTPKSAGEIYDKLSKLKAGDKLCVVDDGS